MQDSHSLDQNKAAVVARAATPDDVAAIHLLEPLGGLPGNHQTPRDKLMYGELSRLTDSDVVSDLLKRQPSSHSVLERAGVVFGAVLVQRVSSRDALLTAQWKNMLVLEDDAGTIAQIVSLRGTCNMTPAQMHKMMRYAITRAFKSCAGVCTIVRCSTFGLHCKRTQQCRIRISPKSAKMNGNLKQRWQATEDSMRAHLETDPVVRVHLQFGGMVSELVPEFDPEDEANCGYGVLIEFSEPGQSDVQPLVTPGRESNPGENSAAEHFLRATPETRQDPSAGRQGVSLSKSKSMVNLDTRSDAKPVRHKSCLTKSNPGKLKKSVSFAIGLCSQEPLEHEFDIEEPQRESETKHYKLVSNSSAVSASDSGLTDSLQLQQPVRQQRTGRQFTEEQNTRRSRDEDIDVKIDITLALHRENDTDARDSILLPDDRSATNCCTRGCDEGDCVVC